MKKPSQQIDVEAMNEAHAHEDDANVMMNEEAQPTDVEARIIQYT